MGLDLPLLRQLVVAFVPAGGVIDRLGDAREKPRDKARDILVRLSSMCFKACGTIQATAAKGKDASKAAETPLAVLERHLREVGLMNKLWRVREQASHCHVFYSLLICEAEYPRACTYPTALSYVSHPTIPSTPC
jgi:hypothetical protein